MSGSRHVNAIRVGCFETQVIRTTDGRISVGIRFGASDAFLAFDPGSARVLADCIQETAKAVDLAEAERARSPSN